RYTTRRNHTLREFSQHLTNWTSRYSNSKASQQQVEKLTQQLEELKSFHSQQLEEIKTASQQEKEQIEQSYQAQIQELQQSNQEQQQQEESLKSQIRELEQELQQAKSSLQQQQQAAITRGAAASGLFNRGRDTVEDAAGTSIDVPDVNLDTDPDVDTE
ncbi:MAG: hypothetical protein AAGM29_01710, partial [Cyanobacteria bacterium J06588_4]